MPTTQQTTQAVKVAADQARGQTQTISLPRTETRVVEMVISSLGVMISTNMGLRIATTQIL